MTHFIDMWKWTEMEYFPALFLVFGIFYELMIFQISTNKFL